MRQVMLALIGFGALFVVGRAQEKQCDENQYSDFLSEVRSWQERAEQAEALRVPKAA